MLEPRSFPTLILYETKLAFWVSYQCQSQTVHEFCILDTDLWNQFRSVQLLSVWLFATPWTAARQASLSITNSWSLLKLMSIESVMPSNHLIFCRHLLLLPSIFPSIRVFLSLYINQSGAHWWSALSLRNLCNSIFHFPIETTKELQLHEWRLNFFSWFYCTLFCYLSFISISFIRYKVIFWTFLVVQWLWFHLLIQGTWVWPLLWEDSTCLGAAGPLRPKYWWPRT